MTFLKEQFILSFNFLRKRLIVPFLIVIMIFIAFSFATYGLMLLFPELSEQLFTTISEIMNSSGIIDENGSISPFLLFLNNARAGLSGAAFGFIPFIFFPVFAIFINGAIMGITLGAYSLFSEVNPLLVFAAGILPHGIFELTAIFICWAMGMGICFALTKKIVRVGNEHFGKYLARCLGVYCYFVIPLLIIAAVVESYVTPVLLNMIAA